LQWSVNLVDLVLSTLFVTLVIHRW
jgi:hypothetical protein